MTTLLSELIVTANLKIWHNARKYSLIDQSGNGLVLSPLGTGGAFQRGSKGPGLTGTIDTGYSAGTSATLDLTTATVFAGFHYYQTPAAYQNHLIVCKGENLGTLINGYYFYISAGTATLCLGDAAAFQAVGVAPLTPGKFYLVSFSFDGTTVRPHLNGLPLASYAQTRVPSPAGKIYKYGFNATTYGLHDVLLYEGGAINRVLTGAEQARLWTDFLDRGWVGDPPRKIAYSYPSKRASEYAAAGIVGDWDFQRQSATQIRDLTGNYPGTIVGVPVPADGKLWPDAGMRFGVNDRVDLANVTQINGATKFTHDVWLQGPPTTYTAGDCVWYQSADATHQLILCYATSTAGTTVVRAYVQDGSGTSYGSSTAVQLRAGCLQHVCTVWDGTQVAGADKLKMFIDGEQVALAFAGAMPGAVANLAATVPRMNYSFRNATNYRQRMRVGVTLTATQVRAEYLEAAKQIDWQCSGEATPVSLVASVGAGAYLGDWRVVSGTWKISEDSTGKRWLECVTAGTCVTPVPTNLLLGTHTFAVYKHQLPSDTRISLLTQPSSVGVVLVGNNGYSTVLDDNRRVRMSRVTDGTVAANLWVTSNNFYAVDTQYQFAVARRASDGRFSQWLQGGAYIPWTTTGGPIADANYFACAWLHFQGGAGDKLLIFDPAKPDQYPIHFVGQLDPVAGELPVP